MRRNVRATLVVLVAVIATLAFAPSSQAASAIGDGQRYTQVSDFPTYTGWARVGEYLGPSQGSSCPVCLDIVYKPARMSFSDGKHFWRWTGAWSQTRVAGGAWVWVAPYATGWSWVWTQQTGWLAAPDANLLVLG